MTGAKRRADAVLGKTGELLSHNLFAYCGNNPVNMADLTGLFPFNISEVSMIPVEQLPYAAHKLAGELCDESMMARKYSIKYNEGTGRIYLPNEEFIEITYHGIRNYYHMDLYIQSKGRTILKNLGDPYKFGQYTPVVPIILEMNYKGAQIRTWAVLHLNYRSNHQHFCAWLYNSDGDNGGSFGTHRTSYGRDNVLVEQASAAFNIADAFSKGGGFGNVLLCVH